MCRGCGIHTPYGLVVCLPSLSYFSYLVVYQGPPASLVATEGMTSTLPGAGGGSHASGLSSLQQGQQPMYAGVFTFLLA